MISSKQIKQAICVLKSGGIVLFPTETCYGLAADASNSKAVKRIFLLKNRDTLQTFPLIASSFRMAEKYMDLSLSLRKIARIYWPGPLTIVSPINKTVLKNHLLAKEVVQKNRTIAMRVSSHPIARALSSGLGRPIVSTSANRQGQSNTYSIQSTLRQFRPFKILPDFFLDGGVLVRRKPSTIITQENEKIKVLRQGNIFIEKNQSRFV
ncbi:threonylcarbamoyl-AMP synthase [Candidatus Uhrbacteria bacterium CG_4_9_14_3_um_filter_36_7]|uniref:L-threonylcarbamoyladenylate synthase n=1 Tax=Candidatus Uhrbacteria bacterium CG_4_9_14_3_um_filter_36_7 TaxID=1975033 RepID=A0A2M7XHL3_9BACT|nr:MAG: threonylcarbamoyl-AMP synthase [Candidatus Uhrbacteria bacterium CG_4_9_14_3_um_filter_36_7]